MIRLRLSSSKRSYFSKSSYFVERAPLMGTFALFGALWALSQQPASEPGEAGVRDAISRATDLEIGTFLWEPSRGVLLDWWAGRGILFEGQETSPQGSTVHDDTAAQDDTATQEGVAVPERAAAPAFQRDIYRLLAQVSPEGHVLDFESPRNLTQTKNGDESDLIGNQHAALFTSRAPNQATSISLLDYSGEANARPVDLLARVQLALARFVDSGSFAGLGRIDLLPSELTSELSITLEKSQLQFKLKEAEQKTLTIDTLWKNGQQAANSSFGAESLTVFPRRREPIAWTHFGANVGRQFLGTGAIAWLEGRVFETWDTLQRAGYSVSHQSNQPAPEAPIPLAFSPQNTVGVWPPADLNRDKSAPAEDGKWLAVRSTLHEQSGEPYFYRTVLHSDPERPYAELHLVAIDMRRLELGMRAGYEDPKPDAGPPGSGQLPNDDSATRVLATFNGAFKVDHGSYGMKAEGRVLVKPVLGAASVVIDASGKVGFGDWGPEMQADDYAAFRQNLDPLVGHGQVNPRGRKIWGDHLYGEGVATTRSSICLHHSGQLLYAWATEATALSLARGLSLAGCVYAIHLDMNPGHCAFLFNNVESVEPLVAQGEMLDSRMQVNTTRYVRWSPKDFFYVALRSGAPRDSAVTWEKAPGQGPAPESTPGIFLGRHSVGGIEMEIDRVAPGRLEFVVEAGGAEASGQGLNDPSSREGLSPDQGARTLAAWGFGHRTRGMRTGLTLGKKVVVPLTRSYASLVLEPNAPPRLMPPGEPLVESESRQVMQLPLLARDGELLASARELGGHRTRSAFCIDTYGNLYFGRVKHDTPALLVQVLLDQGCSLIVEMDRGSHDPPLVERASTENPPHRGYEQTVLYGLARPMAPRTWLIGEDTAQPRDNAPVD